MAHKMRRNETISAVVLVLGCLFTLSWAVSLFRDPRVRYEFHKWQYRMSEEQAEEYREEIAEMEAENAAQEARVAQERQELSEMEGELSVYRRVYEEWTPEDVLKETLVSLYGESAKAAVQCKSLVLESLGLYTDGIPHYSGGEDNLGQEIRENLVEGAVSQLVPEAAGNLVNGAVNGALDGWTQDASLAGILSGIGDGLQSGIAASIDDSARELAAAFLGDSVVTAYEVVSGFGEMDITPVDLLNAIAGEMEQSSNKLQQYLNKEEMTGDDLYQMIYWHYQYNKSGQALNEYAELYSPMGMFAEGYHANLSKQYEIYLKDKAVLHMLGADG